MRHYKEAINSKTEWLEGVVDRARFELALTSISLRDGLVSDLGEHECDLAKT
ncbi:MAG: hypothetical protein ACXADS_00845 [Candidatus Thorarchaeota archaeon]|jgi:hypothetical protein